MIFVSVGGQKPFPRLCSAISALALKHDLKCFMQTADQSVTYDGVTVSPYLSGVEFQERLSECEIFISHAGMGNILAARTEQKHIIVLPRRAALGEHRNDHQLETANALKSAPTVHVAWEVAEIEQILMTLLSNMSDDGSNLYNLQKNSAGPFLEFELNSLVNELIMDARRRS